MIEQIVFLALATLAALGSPGPVPLALAATGASFGARRSTPFLIGILVGLAVVAILTAAGVGVVVASGGWMVTTLLALSFLYFVYIAYKVTTAPLDRRADTTSQNPLNGRDGFVLNLINPKAYAAFTALYAGFGLPIEPNWFGIAATGAVILFVAIIIDVAWLLSGGILAPAFESQRFGRALRIALAVAMLIAVGASIFLAVGR